MFSATRLLRGIFRGNITSKRGNRNFYKGRGAPTMGHHTKRGKYIIDSKKVAEMTFTCPDLTGFPLKPYVDRSVKAVRLAK